MLFFCGCDISQNFLIAKDPGKDTADTGIVITDFFTGKGKVSLNRKPFSMFSRTPPAAGMCRSKVIHNRINPCITDVMTCGGGIGNADTYNRKLSEKKRLNHMGTAQIIMPDNYIALFDTPTTEKAEKIVREAEPDIAKAALER